MDNVFDEHANDYEDWFEKNNQLFQSEVEGVKSLLRKGEKSIEIGCGTGLFTKALAVDLGIDVSPKMLKIAQGKGLKVIEADGTNLPIEDKSFDQAIMITVDCFLSDMVMTFKEVYRVLNCNGQFIVAFIDRETPLGQVYEDNKLGSVYYERAKFHSSREVVDALEMAGFRIGRKCQTVYTLENIYQECKEGFGEGVFAIVQGMK